MAVERAKNAKLPGALMNNVRRRALAVRIFAESKLGRAEDAKKTLALIEEEAKNFPSNTPLRSMVHFARGAEAMSRGDSKAAAQHYTQCNDQDYYCRWQLVVAQEKGGDMAGAAAARTKLLAENRRDPDYLYVRAKLGSKPAAGANGT